jgi:hypothetical protein
LEAVDELMNLGVLTGSTPLTQSLKNLPSDYTTAMALGRTYNAMKGVVSWRYLAMEKVISDYRVAQADVMRSVLSDPNSAKVMAGVLSRGVFKKREGREMLRDIVTKIAPYGYRLSSSNSISEMEEDLERLAASVRKELPDKGKRKTEISDTVEQTDESGVPLGFRMGGQGFEPKTGRFYDITEELPD